MPAALAPSANTLTLQRVSVLPLLHDHFLAVLLTRSEQGSTRDTPHQGVFPGAAARGPEGDGDARLPGATPPPALGSVCFMWRRKPRLRTGAQGKLRRRVLTCSFDSKGPKRKSIPSLKHLETAATRTFTFPKVTNTKKVLEAGSCWNLGCIYYWIVPWYFKIWHFHSVLLINLKNHTSKPLP